MCRLIWTLLKLLSTPSLVITLYSASAWPICSLMVKKFNIYAERADEHYTVLSQQLWKTSSTPFLQFIFQLDISASYLSWLLKWCCTDMHAEKKVNMGSWTGGSYLTDSTKSGVWVPAELGFESFRSTLFSSAKSPVFRGTILKAV